MGLSSVRATTNVRLLVCSIVVQYQLYQLYQLKSWGYFFDTLYKILYIYILLLRNREGVGVRILIDIIDIIDIGEL